MVSRLLKKIALPEWLRPSKLLEWGQEVYEEWNVERQRQRQELRGPRRRWKQQQDERRQQAKKEALNREERRKKEKEASILERERLQQKRQQKNLIKRLQKQQTERNELQQDIADFFNQLEEDSHPPAHIQEPLLLPHVYTSKQKKPSPQKDQVRDAALSSPLDQEIQASLTTASATTQMLAQQAMDAQQDYFEQLQNWKRSEQELLERLQQQALQQSTRFLLQQQEVFEQEETEDCSMRKCKNGAGQYSKS